jgi:hypothetical protein
MTLPRHLLATSVVTLILLYSSQAIPVLGQSSTIGPSVNVTGRSGSVSYSEGLITVDPTSPTRLLICTMRWKADNVRNVVEAHRSIDSGLTWERVFVSPTTAYDPTCAWGPDGTSYILTLSAPDNQHHQLYRSTDGAATWAEAGVVTGRYDRPSTAIDVTNGQFRNRIYIWGASMFQLSTTTQNTLALYRSTDGGRTILGPAQFVVPEKPQLFLPGNSVVSKEGYWFGTYTESLPTEDSPAIDRLPGGAAANARIRVVSSKNGGESFEPPQTVADLFAVRRTSYAGGQDPQYMAIFLPQIAADMTQGQFGGRLYVVWVDGVQGLRLSFSTDGGRSWSSAITLAKSVSNDSGASLDRPSQPMLTINRDGTLLVAWYDRSESKGSLSYRVSFRLSYDGGETFTRPTQVPDAGAVFNGSERWVAVPYITTRTSGSKRILDFQMFGNAKHLYTGGDYNYISADSLGRFHLYWIDNRDGLPQVWTAAITPATGTGKAANQLLANLSDVTDMVSVEETTAEYDQDTGRATLSLSLKNTSTQVIRPPLKLRLLTVDSDFGVPLREGRDAVPDDGSGVIDLSAAISAKGVLGPGELSKSVSLSFLISNQSRSSLRRGSTFGNFVLRGTARLFGRVQPRSSDDPPRVPSK